MRIDGNILQEILQFRSQEVEEVDRRDTEKSGAKAEVGGDEAILSAGARLLQRVREAIDAAPDVREGKIEALRQQIQDGAYEVDEEALIDALIGGSQPEVKSGP
ncbi:MAG: hypothetical protein MAG451_03049 [Anaerolineales bacterium]|nr:hypothetical protein [Anaerolineales bacterium]